MIVSDELWPFVEVATLCLQELYQHTGMQRVTRPGCPVSKAGRVEYETGMVINMVGSRLGWLETEEPIKLPLELTWPLHIYISDKWHDLVQ